MNKFNTALEAKVAARNQVNALANQLSPAIFEALKPFVGTKCFNQGAAISKKLREALPELPNTIEASGSYTTGHGYSLVVIFKSATYSTHNEYDRSEYAEETVYLADIGRNDWTMPKLYDFTPRRVNFTVDEVKTARAELKAAQNLVSAAQSKLCLFGEYDR